MKKTNKGFTLVELIIVIAVIGVLAAILIPVFSNVIEKANIKSAFSDARNALSVFVAEKTNGEGGAVVGDNTVFYVTKAGHVYAFCYYNNGLHEGDAQDNETARVENAPAEAVRPSGIDEFPENVTMVLVEA